jgi:2-phospho-L-lactate/phosphoenolpyruvate guanylyltransferase
MDAIPSGSGPGRMTIAVIPVRGLDGAKSRLGAVLDAEERRDLAERLARRTIRAAVATPAIAETLVVTPDDDVRRLALELGARPLLQRSGGLNQALRQARAEAIGAGADALLVLPTDLPRITSDAISALLDTLRDPARPLVAIVPDRHGRGTNALLLAPPDAIEFCFGGDSRAAHVEAAMAIDAQLVEADGPLTIDLDTPDDLLLAEHGDPELARG